MQTSTAAAQRTAPSLAWMHLSLLLAGLGTALLGPILPLLAHQWQMQDSQSGILMAAKFVGAFCGGVSVMRNPQPSLLFGMVAGLLGFGGFSLAPSPLLGCLSLFIAGFGLGQLITATNILAGRKFTQNRGSALALLNFSFSFGAVLSAFLAARLLNHIALSTLLKSFAACFALGALWLVLELRILSSDSAPLSPNATESPAESSPLPWPAFLYFCYLLFLYGGLETCLSGWLTTFAVRYSGSTMEFSQYATLCLWLSLTVGRILSSFLLLRFTERAVQRTALALSCALTVALAFTHTASVMAITAILLGLSLAPFFPATFSLLMSTRPATRQAGWIVAVSGLGAASLPWLMGVLSTRADSLRVALVVPALAAAMLFTLSLLSPRTRPEQS